MSQEKTSFMNERDTVAVVIPVYNTAPEFIETSIASALAQTYPDVVVYVVDDGSTRQSTRQALATLESRSRVTVLRQENAGAGAARNTAIEAAADARFVFPLDSDDWVDPGYVAAAVKAMRDHPQAGIVYCPGLVAGSQEGAFNAPPYSVAEMVVGNPIPAWGIYRRDDWVAAGGYGLRILEDYDFWLSIIELGREVVLLDTPYYHYRQHGRQATAGIDEREAARHFAVVMRRHPDFFLDHAEDLFYALRTRELDRQAWHQRYGRLEDARHAVGGLVKAMRARLGG